MTGTEPQDPLVPVGAMHRIGFAVEDAAAAVAWCQRILGATPLPSGAVIPFQDPAAPRTSHDAEATSAPLLWFGGHTLLFLAPVGGDDAAGNAGFVRRFLQRWGTGLHSLAWEIDDMWTASEVLRAHGLRITGVDIPGRHFFVHPGDTSGMLLELTDTWFTHDPRRSGTPLPTTGGLLPGAEVAWVSAVVADVGAAAEQLAELAGAAVVEGNPRPAGTSDAVRDLLVGDLVLRLVAPGTADAGGPLTGALAKGARLWSWAVRVPELTAALTTLEGEGVVVAGRAGDVAWTDPATTFGVPMEWVG